MSAYQYIILKIFRFYRGFKYKLKLLMFSLIKMFYLFLMKNNNLNILNKMKFLETTSFRKKINK